MRSRPYRLREVFMENFRCFHEQRSVCLTPLTLLVGDNSTGKTSFLAALRLVWDIAYGKTEPDFRKHPYDLGGYPEVAYSTGGRRYMADSFELGFKTITDAGTPLTFAATFSEKDSSPFPKFLSWSSERAWIKRRASEEGDIHIDFGTSGDSWRFFNPTRLYESSPMDFVLPVVVWIGYASRGDGSPFGSIKPIDGSPEFPTEKELDVLLFELEFFPTSILEKKPFASAPTRSSPQRTYDRVGVFSGEGDHIPIYLADQVQAVGGLNVVKDRLERFGKVSGLFDEVLVKNLGKHTGGPFQFLIRKYSKKRRKGPMRNLVDVGYGVSQALPLVAELLQTDGPYTFLLQQPEVHLHPSAQAAFGSLFCEVAAHGRQLIVETHSEYIIDRIRMDIRDRRTALKPDDVSILFFERSDFDVRIHSLRFDEQGNVLGAPAGYGQFFVDEARRSVGL